VVDGNGSFVGILDRANILQSVKQAGPDARVADAMTALPVLTVG
jgi:predicted transcriptional regulator